MKKLVFIFLCVSFFIACDKVKQPDPYANIDCSLDKPTVTTILTSTVSSDVKKVLLEDYTGHTCGNCPRAARKAESLEATYGEKLIVIAAHVSNQFAAPDPKTCYCAADTMYKEDFRSGTGTDWDTYFGLSSAGLPKGMVNRGKPYAQSDGGWTGLVNTAINEAQSVKLEVTCTYDTVGRYIRAKVKSTFLKDFTTNIMMEAVLTLDSTVAFQKDYNPPSGAITEYDADLRPNYRFDNVLLGSLNGSWGQLTKASPKNKDTVTVTTPCYQVQQKCFYSNNNKYGIKDVCVNDKYINLVVFVYDNDSKEVLQVEKLRIRGGQ